MTGVAISAGLTASRTRRRISPVDVALGIVTALLFVYVYLPVGVIVVLAFSDADLAVFPIQSFSTRWFSELFSDAQVIAGLRNSLIVAVGVVALAVPLGLLLAYYLVRRARGRKAAVLSAVAILPMQTPRIIVGVLLLIFFSMVGVRPSLLTVLLSHVALTLPFATLIVAARLRGIDPALEEAAWDLGASRWRVWLDVLLPMLAPAILAATLITFTISFDEMVVSYFTIGNESTLPVLIWSMLSFGYTQKINAIGTLIIVPTLIVLAAAQLLRSNRTGKVDL